MVPKAAKRLRRIHGPDGFAGQDDFAARFGDSVSEFIIVRECVGYSLEPAHFPEPFPGCRDGSPESESDSFRPFSHQDAGKKTARSAGGFDLRAEIFVGDAAVKASHRANFKVRKPRDNFAQKARSYAHIAIGQDQYIVLRFSREPRQLVYLAVCAKMLRADEQTNLSFRKLSDDSPNDRQYRICVVVHRKQNLVIWVF